MFNVRIILATDSYSAEVITILLTICSLCSCIDIYNRASLLSCKMFFAQYRAVSKATLFVA